MTLPGHETEFPLGLTPRRPEMPTNEAPGCLTGYSCMLCFIDDLSDHGGRNGLDMTPWTQWTDDCATVSRRSSAPAVLAAIGETMPLTCTYTQSG